MKRLALVLALAIASAALAADPSSTAQALTGTAPSGTTEGMVLSAVRGFRVSVCAESGQTLSGAGTLQAWYRDPGDGLWKRNPSLDLTVNASSVRCQVFPDQRVVASASGRVFYVTSGVTVSGGTTVTTRIVPTSVQP